MPDVSSRPKTRIERDSLGTLEVPADAYYGVQTARAVQNFPISGERLHIEMVRAAARIKIAAARANMEVGALDRKKGDAIVQAAEEVLAGRFDGDFVVDAYQAGAGTSFHMNVNEVIANRACEILGGKRGDHALVSPNDHVNMAQSTNDVIPTAMRLSAYTLIGPVLEEMRALALSLGSRAKAFSHVLKSGRTHLQDATPIRLGQEFSGYARQIELGISRVQRTRGSLEELALGGTAVGTGLNAHPEFAPRVIALLAKDTGCALKEAQNHFEAQAAQDSLIEASGALKTVAVSLMKIANDIRWMGSGPRCGIGEIIVPATQPGSSIMPGKVNPVIAESVMMVAAEVIGNDVTITVAGQAGNFELLVMLPVMAHNLLESILLLSRASENFARRCIEGIEPDRERCQATIEESLAMCTALAPEIGYDAAAEIAKEAHKTGKRRRVIILSPGQS